MKVREDFFDELERENFGLRGNSHVRQRRGAGRQLGNKMDSTYRVPLCFAVVTFCEEKNFPAARRWSSSSEGSSVYPRLAAAPIGSFPEPGRIPSHAAARVERWFPRLRRWSSGPAYGRV